DRLLAGLGSEWLMLTMRMKPYACHSTSTAIVQGIQEFKKKNLIDPKMINRVVVASPRAVEGRYLILEPTSILGWQYSIPFNVAVAFSRDMSNPLIYNEETLWDPVVRELSKKVEAREGDTAEVVIEVAGERHIIKGSLPLPLNFDGTCEKFQRYIHTMVEKTRGDKMQELVRDLDQLSDMAQLARLIKKFSGS
ncbi:hypothetical protein ACFLVH_03195, partial [Chloroflexota bacterium]